jgi:hypothetical protein
LQISTTEPLFSSSLDILYFLKFWRWLSNGFNLEISGYWNWRLFSGFWIICRLAGIGLGDQWVPDYLEINEWVLEIWRLMGSGLLGD